MAHLSLVRLQPIGFLLLRDCFVLILVAAAAHLKNELFALRSFECEVTLEARTTRHSTPAAVAKQRYSTNPERVPACNRRRSNSCKPSAPFLPASVDAKRHQVNARPRTPVADFAPRGRAAADRIMSACQRPRVSHTMKATPTAPSSRSRRGFPLRAAGDPGARTGSWPLQPPGESGAMSGSIGVKTT